MPGCIYVLSHDGHPLMPTKRRRHVEKLLSRGKARIASHTPFTIQLKYQTEGICQPLIMGIDPGRTNIGMSVLNKKGDIVFSAVCETRNKEIRKLMEKRKACRRASRRGERKARQRRARRFGTMLKAGFLMRKLPRCESEVLCKIIRNTESRFCNRARPEGWLTPTVEQLVRTHSSLLRKVKRILPVTDAAVEVNRFAFMLLENPGITGLDFQNGPLKGYADVKAAVYDTQGGFCLTCGAGIEAYHHIVPRHKGGSDTFKNLAGLCGKCHKRAHTEPDFGEKLQSRKSGMLKKYHDLSALNQAVPFICKALIEELGESYVHFTNGRRTAEARKALGIKKSYPANPCHVEDACIIAASGLGIQSKIFQMEKVYTIRQFRRHDRALVKAQRERTYYLERKAVAKNRRRRFEQTAPSLHDWYLTQKKLHGKAEAHRLQQMLSVKPSKRSYNNLHRVMPGTRFVYGGQEYVLTGQMSNGKYYRAYGCGEKNFPASKCRILRQNEGLIYVA